MDVSQHLVRTVAPQANSTVSPFGWNIGYGFGDTSAATENVLFYDGKIQSWVRSSLRFPWMKTGLRTS